MRIEIVTTGDANDTEININGERIKTLKEFNLSIQINRKVKLQMVKEIDGKNEFLSYYSGDFQKYDEYHPEKIVTKEN